jgi:cell division protein YceG involved in septum cleavage
MMDELPGGDPFSPEDPDAAERERRRREREERRRGRSKVSRRSLGERVSGALDHTPPRPAKPSGRRSEPARGSGHEGASGATVLRRRLIAGGGILAIVALVAVLISVAGDDGGEAESAVAEPTAAPTTSVTIPEGLTRAQIAELAEKAKLKGSYMKASKRAPKGFKLKRYGAGDAPSLEGFLFPATYELEQKAPASDLVAKQLQAFEDNLDGVDLREAKRKNLTPYDVLIIASMVEREVSVPEERRLVAAVIYNRLSAGEPLGVDATLRYELDNFDEPLKESELATDTPYNTRLYAGLPPTPIGNPGLASIKAAAKPADKDFRYYVIKPGTCNEHFFTADAAEFDAAVAKYQAALEAEGGSPTKCPK